MKRLRSIARKSVLMTAPAYVDSIEMLKDEPETFPRNIELDVSEIPHANPGELEAIKNNILGHGEQTVLPDDCKFGDNDLCYVEA